MCFNWTVSTVWLWSEWSTCRLEMYLRKREWNVSQGTIFLLLPSAFINIQPPGSYCFCGQNFKGLALKSAACRTFYVAAFLSNLHMNGLSCLCEVKILPLILPGQIIVAESAEFLPLPNQIMRLKILMTISFNILAPSYNLKKLR